MNFDGYEMKFKFNASHYINIKNPNSVHTHTFHIICYIKNENKNFISYTTIVKNIEEYLSKFRGKCINDISPFNSISPTIENMCKVFYKTIDAQCKNMGVDLYKLSISDNSISWYSLGEYILIDSINESIPSKKILEYLDTIGLKEKIQEENLNG